MTDAAPTTMVEVDDFRCSTWNRALRVDPIGSAGQYEGYLVVEWPLPWPTDVAETPELHDVAAAARRVRIRLQAAVPAAYATTGLLRVSLYHRDRSASAPPGFAGLVGSSSEIPPEEVAETALGLLATLEGAPRAAELRPNAGRVVLVCTHGRRDRCCGSLGTTLVAALDDRPALLGDGVQLARTSHTGGHRFAPTALILPDATAWAYLDAPLLGAIVAGTADPVLAAGHYRGCALVGEPALQALERSVFALTDGPGFELFKMARGGSVGADGDAVLHVSGPDGRTATYTARVCAGRRVPVPACGLPIEDATSFADELEVSDLRRL